MGKRTTLNLKKKIMKYVAAYCLLVLGGKENPTAADLKKAMTEAGCDVAQDNLDAVCNALKGKQLHEVINAGFGKIASLSLGGGGSSSGPSNNAGPAQADKKAEAAKVEEPEEEEEDMDIGDLFG